LSEVAWLVKNGVPWGEAMAMDAEERFGFCIIFGRFEGQEWDWEAGRWRGK
jgi:hypothetical protein